MECKPLIKKIYLLTSLLTIIIAITGCLYLPDNKKINKVGMLIEGSVDDNTWDKKGLQSLRNIKEEHSIDAIFKYEINEKQKIINTVDDFVENGVNLIYGHGSYYGKTFVEIAHQYPNVHFIYFNGNHYAENVTSVHFNSHALGFFAGMVAGKMTQTNHIGAISAYEWQPEIEGFFEGAKYENQLVNVHIEYINDWDNQDMAIQLYEKMAEKQVDVVYPAGDFFSESIINKASENESYAIGFLEDQGSVQDRTVLTSTVRDVEKTYEQITKKFNQGELDGGILTFDFEDKIVSLGTFNTDVPKSYQNMLDEEIEKYKKTGLLPYQR